MDSDRNRSRASRERNPKTRGNRKTADSRSVGSAKSLKEEIEPIILDSLDFVRNHIEDNWISHVFGFTASNTTRDLITTYLSIPARKDSIRFICLKTNERVLKTFQHRAKSVKGDIVEYDPLIGVYAGEYEKIALNVNKTIFCTTRKMISLLLKNRDNFLSRVSTVVIDSWDEYDVNAFALLGLLEILKEKLPKCHVVLTSVSRWIAPSIELKLTPVCLKFKDIKIEYQTDSTALDMIAAVSKFEGVGVIAYLGNLKDEDIDEDIILLGTHPLRNTAGKIVIDSMKNQYGGYITKQLADLRANSISKGFVNRCISEVRYFGLRDTALPKEKVGLDSLIIFFLGKGYKPKDIRKILMKSHEADVDKFLEELNSRDLTTEALKLMKITYLDINSAIFLNNWITTKKHKSNNRIQNNRILYVGILIACLINQKPQIYSIDGDTKIFDKFRGRNDIETMCNMWLDLQTSFPVSFIILKDVEYRTSDWANSDRDNKFNQDSILELFNLIKNICVRMLKDTRKKDKEETKDKKPKYGHGIFNQITEVEINDAVEIIKHIFSNKKVKWDFSEALPSSVKRDVNKVVYPIQSKGATLYMYVTDVKLEPFLLKTENLDAFMLLD